MVRSFLFSRSDHPYFGASDFHSSVVTPFSCSIHCMNVFHAAALGPSAALTSSRVGREVLPTNALICSMTHLRSACGTGEGLQIVLCCGTAKFSPAQRARVAQAAGRLSCDQPAH